MIDFFRALLVSVSNIDPLEPKEGDTTTADTRANFSAAKTEIEALQDGKVAGPASSVNNNLMAFSGTSGKVAVDSGSSPSDFEPANANIQAHIGSSANPHSVTKAQVGLGNADNTSDADKPVSTAQSAEFLERPKRPTPATTVVGRIVEWNAIDGTLLRQSTKSTADLEADTAGVQSNLDTHAADNTHLSAAERAGIDNMANAPTNLNPFISQDDFASGGGHVIQDSGANMAQRANLNFTGTGVTVADNAGNNATDITITAGSGGGATQLSELSDVGPTSYTNRHVLAANGSSYAERALVEADISNLGTYTPTSRTLTAGTGLSGGGDLSANRSFSVDYGTGAGTACEGNDSRLSDARPPTAHTHVLADVTDSGAMAAEADAPNDGQDYVRKNLGWAVAPSGGGDLTDATFPTHAKFFSQIAAAAAVDFGSGNCQQIADATGLTISLTAPGVGHYTLVLESNSNALTGFSTTINWENGTVPVWTGRSVVLLHYTGSIWIGSGMVGVA